MRDKYKVRLRRFTNRFDSAHRLYKLHGSIDMYSYNDKEQFDFIKTVNGIGLTDICKETTVNGTAEYNYEFYELIPNVLSGTTEKILSYDTFYFKDLFDHFKTNLNTSEHLYIIGYGFGDSEINKIIKEEFIDKGNKVVIVSPNTPSHLS